VEDIMTERSGIYMMEQDARLHISSILSKLREAHCVEKERKGQDDSSSIEYHVKRIFKAGGGIWNESFAKDYIEDLEAEVGRLTKAYRHVAL
jgi:hypothetical protein